MPASPIRLTIKAPFGGYAPSYWENSLGSFGNKNMARTMTNIDMADPSGIQQGPGLATLTNGDENGVVTTLIQHILPVATSTDISYAVGGSLLYQITPTIVGSGGGFPHTIDKAGVTGEDGESVCLYSNDSGNPALYYLYNYSSPSAGDIGRFDLTSTFDDDWGSTVPATGAAVLNNAPHPSVVGNDDVMYFGNGRYVGYYDWSTDTLAPQDFDTPVGGEVVDVRYLRSRVWVAINFPNVAGDNNSQAVIYTWAGVGVSSWDDSPNPRWYGKVGAIYPMGARMFVWYQEVGYTGGYKLGYVNGDEIVEVAAYSGTLPSYYQVSEKDGMLVWQSNGVLHRWGATSRSVPPTHHQYADGGYATVGGIGAPFGTMLVASTESTNYKLAKLSGYDVNSDWKSLIFQTGPAMIDVVKVWFESPGSGARADLSLYKNLDADSMLLQLDGQTGSISNASDSAKAFKEFQPNYEVKSDFALGIDFANGSAVNPVKIRRIDIIGHTLDTK